MADLSSYSDAELLAMYGTPTAAPETETGTLAGASISVKPKRETGFLQGGGRQIQRRGVGLIQLGMEGVGATDNEFYKASQKAAKQLEEESKGTGFWDTAGEVVADPLNVALAPFGGASVWQLIKLGFLGGGAEGLTRPTKEGDSRLANTGVSAVTGAIAAPVIGKAMGAIGSGADKVLDVGKGLYQSAKQALGNFADDSLIGLEVSAGSTYDDIARAVQGMSDDAIALFKDGVKAGLSPRQSYIAAKAKDQGVTLTKGMLTQDPAAQRLEDYAAQGLLNQNASKIATATGESNKAAMSNWAGKLGDDVSGVGNAPLDETTVADAVGSAVKAKAAALKAPAGEAYKAGMKSKARVATEDLAGFVPNLKASLRSDGIDYNASTRFKSDIRAMEKLTAKVTPVAPKITAKETQANGLNNYLTSNYAKPATKPEGYGITSFRWPAIEKMQQRLNSRAQFGVNLNGVSDYAAKQEILAYRNAANKFRSHTDDIITNGLLKNPDEASAALMKAPALYKQYKQAIYGKDGKAALGVIVDNDLTDRQVADLFGSSLAGKGDTQKVVAQLKNVLGEDAPEFGQVRGMFLNRLFKGALTQGDEIGAKGFGTRLNTDWKVFKTKNKALMDELFTPQQQAEISDFVSTAYLMSARNASKTNPSGSGIAVMDGAINLLNKIGGNGIVSDLAKAGGKAALLRGNSKQAIKSITDPLKSLGSNTTVIADALRRIGGLTGVEANRISSDALSQQPVTAAPVTAPANPLEGMSDDELLNLYNAPQVPETIPDTDEPLPDHIQQDEGLRHESYLDTVGARTVGYGFNMDSGIARSVWKKAGIPVAFDDVYNGKAAITDAQASALGRTSYGIALNDAISLYDKFHKLSEPRKEALVNLSYQIGKTKLSKFSSFNAAVNKGNWPEAVRHLLKTQYAEQTPKRAREVARKLLKNNA